MAEAAVAEDVKHHVLVEFLAELGGDAGGMHHRLGVVAVDVENRRFHHQGDVRGIGGRPAEGWGGGKADLVVHHDVDRAAGAVADKAGQAEAFGDHTLTGKGGIAVQQDGQHLFAGLVAKLFLLGADLAQNHGVHRLQMAGVRGQRQVDGVAIKAAVGRGAKVVFHIARTIDIFRLEAATLEFVENGAVGLHQHIGQHRQAAPVRHADDDFLHAQRAAALDDLFHRRDQAFAAVQAEAFGAHVFDMQEFLKAFGLDQLVQDRLAALAGEGNLLAIAFDAFLQPGGLFGVGDVHVLQGKGAAIGALHDFHDLAHRGVLQAQDIVDEDRPVHVGLGEAIGFGVEFRLVGAVGHAQRIKIGGQVAPDAVGADDHDGADGVEHGTLDLRIGEGDAGFGGFGGDFRGGGTGVFLWGRQWPVAGQGGG